MRRRGNRQTASSVDGTHLKAQGSRLRLRLKLKPGFYTRVAGFGPTTQAPTHAGQRRPDHRGNERGRPHRRDPAGCVKALPLPCPYSRQAARFLHTWQP